MCRDPWVYVAFLSAVLSSMSLAYFLQQFERHQKWDWHRIFFNGFRMYFGFPCTYEPKNNANRILFLMVLFACSIFVVVITATIIKIITVPILYPQVNSIEEITNGGFSLVGRPFELHQMTQQSKVKFP